MTKQPFLLYRTTVVMCWKEVGQEVIQYFWKDQDTVKEKSYRKMNWKNYLEMSMHNMLLVKMLIHQNNEWLTEMNLEQKYGKLLFWTLKTDK